MRFLIFVDDRNDALKRKTYKAKNALYVTQNWEEAYTKYEEVYKSNEYDAGYLIFDFGITKKFSRAKCDVFKGKFQYLIIGCFSTKYNLYENIVEKSINPDFGLALLLYCNFELSLESDGFIHSFQDEKAAITKFMYFVDNNIDCDLIMKYTDVDKRYISTKYHKKVSEAKVVSSYALNKNISKYSRNIFINPRITLGLNSVICCYDD